MKEEFCDKLFSVFEAQIIDNIFCFIQNDKYLMKAYLDLVAKEGNLGTVNRFIGKAITKRYNLQSKELRGTPTNNLIQTYSELEK